MRDPGDDTDETAEEPAPPTAEESEADFDDEDSLHDETSEERTGRFARLRKRILDGRDLTDDAKHLLGSALETSDRARKEVVRMMGREVRGYLDALELKEDLMSLLQSHSLEVKASFFLKPLPRDDEEVEEKPEPTEVEGEE